MNKRLIVTTLFFAGFIQQGMAQNNASPYSILGIGDLEKSSFDRTTGMGHTGLALSSNRFLYHANPASYASLDDKYFNFEISARYRGVAYAGTPITSADKSQSSDLQFKKVTMAIKLKKFWGISAGLMPYSTQNYSFLGTKYAEGIPTPFSAYYEGTGSINQFYLANSFKLNKHFSVGVQTAYLFGQLQQNETLLTNIADSLLVTQRNIVAGAFHFKGGIQYHANLNSKWAVAAGATGSLQSNLNNDYKRNVTYGGNTVIDDYNYKSSIFKIPVMYAGGLAFTKSNIVKKGLDKYTFATDYNFQNWTGSNTPDIVNSQRISAGFEYAKNLLFRDPEGNNFLYESYFLQAGVFYSDSYLKVRGEQLKDYGVTFGLGTSLKRSGLGIQLGLEIGKRGTTNNGLIRENYTQVNFTVSYRDFWFTNRKRYN